MAAITQIKLVDTIRENRWAAEFFDPKYAFIPNSKYEWIRIGRILTKCQYGLSLSMNEGGKGFPIFRMNEIEECFLTEAIKYADISQKDFEQFKLNKNDVLFNRTNSIDFVGRTGILKENTESTFASYLIRVNTNEDHILPEFLTIYLNTKFGKGQIRRRAMPSINQANVSASELKRILIPLVDKKSQQEIANLVNRSFKLKKESKFLYTQATLLLEQKLGLNNSDLNQYSSKYVSTFNELILGNRIDSEYFNPRVKEIVKRISNLEHTRVGVHFRIKNGYPWNSSRFLDNNSGEPVIRIRDIKQGYIENERLTSLVVGYAASINFPKAQPGDIVIGMDGIKYFLSSIVEEPCLVNQRVCHISPKESGQISSEYVSFIINSEVGQAQLLRDMTIATTVGHITNANVAKLIIPIVSKKFHDEITNLVRESIEAQKESKRLLAQAKTEVETLIEQAAKSN